MASVWFVLWFSPEKRVVEFRLLVTGLLATPVFCGDGVGGLRPLSLRLRSRSSGVILDSGSALGSVRSMVIALSLRLFS